MRRRDAWLAAFFLGATGLIILTAYLGDHLICAWTSLPGPAEARR